MDLKRILLVEILDAAGAAACDLLAHARTLRAAGCEVRCAVVVRERTEHSDAPPVAAEARVIRPGARGRAELREWLAADAADAVLVAGATRGGGGIGRWLERAPAPPAWWWPTGVGADGAAPGRPRPPRRADGLPVLPGFEMPGEPWPDACAGLEAGVLADARLSRRQLPLWDGAYLLVPAALAGAAGEAALDAFAALCEVHDGLDLVVLADPQPAFERLARARGIGFRVHFAGAAPRDAELAWLGAAGATLIAGDAPLSGGLVLRALARGCPVLAAPAAPIAAPLEAWLAARGVGAGDLRAPLAARLEHVLRQDPAWTVRAQETLQRHRVDAVAERLARSLGVAFAGRRAA